MNYRRMLVQRQPLWDRFEADLARLGRPRELDHAALERLVMDYRAVLHDHARLASRFPDTGAAARVARLAAAGTRALALAPPQRRRGPLAFFTESFPAALWRQRGTVGLAAVAFLTCAVLGFGLVLQRPAMVPLLVGEGTVEDLERGVLWTESITRSVPASVTSSRIATNNLSVALGAWAGGPLLGLWTSWIVLYNGFHFGSILAVTLHFRMAGRLLDFVAAHGPLELSLIIVCAGAGLSLTRALVAASDRARSVELREAGRDSLVIVGGCLPWIVLLGGVEAWVSPDPGIAGAGKLTIGLALWLAFLLLASGRLARVGKGVLP